MEVWRRYGAARYCNYLVKAATLLTEQSLTYARNMDYVWNMYRIGMEHAWNMHGVCIEHIWNMYGTYVEYLRNANGIHMHAICMDCA